MQLDKKIGQEEGDKTVPFVSIIVVAKNEEKNISNCLESLVAQDYPKGKYDEAFRQQALEDYYEKYVGPWFCAGRGLIDNVIRPEDTRLEIIKHLEGLLNKKQIDIPPKKHGNIYL